LHLKEIERRQWLQHKVQFLEFLQEQRYVILHHGVKIFRQLRGLIAYYRAMRLWDCFCLSVCL